MANEVQITVPDIGDFDAVEVIEVLVSPGDSVDVEDGILTMETDKASMDVPTTVAGEVVSVSVKVGDKISEGDVIAVVRTAAADAADGQDDEPAYEATQTLNPRVAEEALAAGAAGSSDNQAGQEPAPTETAAPASEKSQAGEPADAKTVTIVVPDIGDFDSVDVIEVEVSVGDEIDVDDPLMTLETDKASMDIPATHAGKITKVLVSPGDQVSQGMPIVEVATSGAQPAAASAAPADAPSAAAQKPTPAPAPEKKSEQPDTKKPVQPKPSTGGSSIDEAGFSRAHASPSVRKLARQLGVDLVKVKGSGSKGRIVADDVKTWVKSALAGGGTTPAGASSLPAVPKVDFAKFGEVSESPLTRIQKISGPRLQASWINLPHVTQHDLADITDMEARRQSLKGKAAERGVKLTPLAFIMRAVVQALAEYPRLNSSLSQDGSALVNKHYCHIGFAADTDDGLVVPVIHDADKMDVYELAKALADLSAAARDGKLTAKQMQGATFTISSLGGIGGTAFTPIVNAPEVAILGVSRSTMQPVWTGDEFVPRLMLPLSLSYDHRVVDGALAVRFTTQLGQCLGNVDGLLQAIP